MPEVREPAVNVIARDRVFAGVAITSLLSVLVLLMVHYVRYGPRHAKPDPHPERRVCRNGWWEILVHAVPAVRCLVRALPGLGGALYWGELAGWALWLHVLVAPVFTVSLTAMAITWAERCRFARYDGVWLRQGGGYFQGRQALLAGRYDAGQKLFFWCGITAGFVTLASASATTVPLFGQAGQEVLLEVHRYAGLTLTLAVLFHLYVTLLVKPGTWRAMVTGYVSVNWADHYHRWWCEDLEIESEQGHA